MELGFPVQFVYLAERYGTLRACRILDLKLLETPTILAKVPSLFLMMTVGSARTPCSGPG